MLQTQERPGGGTGANSTSDQTNLFPESNPTPRQLRQRRAAAERMRRLDDGHSDPWHHEPLSPSHGNLLAARRAWWHLRSHGLLSELTEAVLREVA